MVDSEGSKINSTCNGLVSQLEQRKDGFRVFFFFTGLGTLGRERKI